MPVPKDPIKYQEWKDKIGRANTGKKHPNRKSPPPFSKDRIDGLKKRMSGIGNPFYGKHHSMVSINKISVAKKGTPNLLLRDKKLSSEHKQKLSEAHKSLFIRRPDLIQNIIKRQTGRKQTAETIEKRVSHFRGKKRPEWVVSKIRAKNLRGEKSHFWKGGASSLAKRLRESPEYKKWRNFVFTRDDYICQDCKKRGQEIEAHHIKRFVDLLRENNIKTIDEAIICHNLWNTVNGVTLCIDCHRKTENYGRLSK